MKTRKSDLFLVLMICAMFLLAPAKEQTKDARAILAADPSAGKILNVPFIPQTPANCGPTSLAMVLQYYRISVSADEIAKKFETKALSGVFTVDLVVAANEYGLEAHWLKSDLAGLRAEINQDRPVIVFVNKAINPLPQRHFAVAVGYLKHKKKDYLVLHSGKTAFLMVPVKNFSREWKRTGNMMLTLKPKAPSENPEEKKT